jgi:hypothetical protein
MSGTMRIQICRKWHEHFVAEAALTVVITANPHPPSTRGSEFDRIRALVADIARAFGSQDSKA